MDNINNFNTFKSMIANSMTSGIYTMSRVSASGINFSNHSQGFHNCFIDEQIIPGIVCGQFVCGTDENPGLSICKQ